MSGFASGFPYFGNMGPRVTEDYSTGLRLGMSLGVSRGEGEEEEGSYSQRNKPTPVQLDLLPLGPAQRDSSPRDSSPAPTAALNWNPLVKTSSWTASANGICDVTETRSCGAHGVSPLDIDMNQMPLATDYDDDAVVSSPNSTVSSFHMDSAMHPGSHASSGKRERDENNMNGNEHELERACSRGSDEEEGDATRKKLRLSKEQSALLEESFKEHNTLNPVINQNPLTLCSFIGIIKNG
eukprot:Gb_29897 [translate_table: standard]